MLELIHDIAPAAELAFHTANPNTANFAQGILDLAAAGADVIVDDITYPTQPFFQDGIVAQAAATVAAQGIPFFSSAGNQGRVSYESQWRSNGNQAQINGRGPYIAHDFDPGPGLDNFQLVALEPGGSTRIVFQWDQPFASAGGAATANDLDIFAFDFQSGILVARSDRSNVGGDAFEILSLQNPSSQPLFLNILIAQYLPAGGPVPGRVKYLSFSPSFDIGQFDTQSPTLFGHHQAVGGAGIAAASYLNTPAFGVSPPQPQQTTSAGGIPILFDTAGNRLATPVVRQQPVVTAPDNTNTTFFIPGNDPDNDGFPNFSGTSAAAPHAAAVAALMLEAAGGPGSLTPQTIYTTMQQTAIDMNSPGFDFDTGFGLVNAEAAIEAVRTTPPPPPPPPAPNVGGSGIGEAGRITVTDEWTTVSLDQSYTDPVVIAGPASFAGTDPVTIRLRNVGPNSFQVRLQEWDYLDGNHANETVSYVVVESGTYELPDGTRVHAGRRSVNHNEQRINFPGVFDSTPVVHSQSQTFNGPAAIVTRQRQVNAGGFSVRLQEEENADGTHSNEQVGYIAFETGGGTVGDSAYRIARAGNVNDAFRTVNFQGTFDAPPVFLASMQTTAGS
ncbi:MAG TPA: serine protease, partial [Planctomycetaceae bacterium]|nr:serine protease [Planctomycetaceae bacterium]